MGRALPRDAAVRQQEEGSTVMASQADGQQARGNPAPRTTDGGEERIPPPVGTLFILVAYLAILAGMWGVMYLGLLERFQR